MYNLEPYYKRTDSAYYIWKHVSYNQYFVSTAKGTYEDSWATDAGKRTGVLAPFGTYTGHPVIVV